MAVSVLSELKGSEFIVDGYGPGFGDNGSFLPFNPAATGAIYTGSYVGEPYGTSSWEVIFSGVKGKNEAQTVSTEQHLIQQ